MKDQNQSALGGEPPEPVDPIKFYFEEAQRVNGMQPPKGIRGRFVNAIKAAVADRQRQDVILRAITRCVEEAISPASFEEVMWRVQSELAHDRSPDDKRLLDAFIGAHGGAWPTGTRWSRGLTAGTYVQDVLGYDRPSYSVPWGPPKREAVIAALKALDAAGVDITRPGVRAPREGQPGARTGV